MTIRDKRAELGERAAKSLNLRRAKGFYPARWILGPDHGTKTAVGVYETVVRIADEARRDLETPSCQPKPGQLPLPDAFGPANWDEFQASLRRRTPRKR